MGFLEVLYQVTVEFHSLVRPQSLQAVDTQHHIDLGRLLGVCGFQNGLLAVLGADDLLGIDILQADTHCRQHGGIRQDIVELDTGGERVADKDSVIEVGTGHPFAFGHRLTELYSRRLRLRRALLR